MALFPMNTLRQHSENHSAFEGGGADGDGVEGVEGVADGDAVVTRSTEGDRATLDALRRVRGETEV